VVTLVESLPHRKMPSNLTGAGNATTPVVTSGWKAQAIVTTTMGEHLLIIWSLI